MPCDTAGWTGYVPVMSSEAGKVHAACFDVDETGFAESVGAYLVETLDVGGTAIVVAGEANTARFQAVVGAREQIVWVDAERLLADILLADGSLAPARFDAMVRPLIDGALRGKAPLRVYGELVGLLWAAGNVEAAMEIERAWNLLLASRSFSLLCGYPLTGPGAGNPVDEICELHELTQSACSYPCRPEAVPEARRFVRRELERIGHGEPVREAAALIATELAANAVTHARSSFTTSVAADGSRVRIAVSDAATGEPAAVGAGREAISGRGITIVSALAHAWGTTGTPRGKQVWAELLAN
jgi:anti-sigma regulatory factor (Ser/Thr protein kinase)